MIELAERHNLFLLIDEAYKDFVYSPEPYFSPAQVSAVRHRVVRVFTFSKAYGMTGWRVGYLHTAAPYAREILKVHDALVTCAPVVSQYAAMAALTIKNPRVRILSFPESRTRSAGRTTPDGSPARCSNRPRLPWSRAWPSVLAARPTCGSTAAGSRPISSGRSSV